MIHWLIQSTLDHPALAAGAPPAGLLSAPELTRWAQLRGAKRQQEWLLGRWTAKQLVCAYLAQSGRPQPALDKLIIENDPQGAPYVVGDGNLMLDQGSDPVRRRLPLRLSISHSHGYACCALLPLTQPATLHPPSSIPNQPSSIGVDLELIQPWDPAFVQDFFTPDEKTLMMAAPHAVQDLLATAIWSAKEAVCKALGMALRLDGGQIACLPQLPDPNSPAEWLECWVTPNPALPQAESAIRAWWRLHEGFVLTLAILQEI